MPGAGTIVDRETARVVALRPHPVVVNLASADHYNIRTSCPTLTLTFQGTYRPSRQPPLATSIGPCVCVCVRVFCFWSSGRCGSVFVVDFFGCIAVQRACVSTSQNVVDVPYKLTYRERKNVASTARVRRRCGEFVWISS